MKFLVRAFAFLLMLGVNLSALAANPQVELKTNKGTLVLELYPDKAPKSVANFLQYVKDGFYAGTIFHRVIPGFMIQGGGFDAKMKQKATRAPIPNEASNGLKNDAGTIAMARTNNPNSATAQFFINLVDNTGLNAPAPDGYGYAVFGKVVKGAEVVQAIGNASTGTFPVDRGMFENVPDKPIIIESAKLLTPSK
ncbi:MAG: peptidylprolyl isomerase [Rhodocyclaceae bacterium]|nr:peptidylprolyl isomerase [Rhodocyclaceae bacterium]